MSNAILNLSQPVEKYVQHAIEVVRTRGSSEDAIDYASRFQADLYVLEQVRVISDVQRRVIQVAAVEALSETIVRILENGS